jgi:hypothetical protein
MLLATLHGQICLCNPFLDCPDDGLLATFALSVSIKTNQQTIMGKMPLLHDSANSPKHPSESVSFRLKII